MKTLRLTILAAILSACCGGCLWIVRVPFPVHEEFSDEGECTNRVWQSCWAKMRECTNETWRIYPTVQMRCFVTKEYFAPIDADAKGEDLYRKRWFKRAGWIPLTVIWMTSPLDAAVDTIMLPFDIYQ